MSTYHCFVANISLSLSEWQISSRGRTADVCVYKVSLYVICIRQEHHILSLLHGLCIEVPKASGGRGFKPIFAEDKPTSASTHTTYIPISISTTMMVHIIATLFNRPFNIIMFMQCCPIDPSASFAWLDTDRIACHS